MSKQPSTNVNNPELLIWAAYQLEAFEEWVHKEAIFLKAFELAPLRLSWATRPDIPDKHIIAGAFQKTVRENPDFFVKNNQGLDVADGRQDKSNLYRLTLEGKEWCEAYEGLLGGLYGGGLVQAGSHGEDGIKNSRIEKSQEFKRWEADKSLTFEKWELAQIFGCTASTTPAQWKSSFDSYMLSAQRSKRKDIQDFIKNVMENIEKK